MTNSETTNDSVISARTSDIGCYSYDETFFSYADDDGILSLTLLRSGHIVFEISEFHEEDDPDDSEVVIARQVLDPDAFFMLLAWGSGKA